MPRTELLIVPPPLLESGGDGRAAVMSAGEDEDRTVLLTDVGGSWAASSLDWALVHAEKADSP